MEEALDEEEHRKLEEMEAQEQRSYGEEDINEMLSAALNIRITKQPHGHIQIAYSYVAAAEWWWTAREYLLVIDFYRHAMEIFIESETGKLSKQVAQLSGWTAVAHLAIGDYEAATEWNVKAIKLSEKVFGKESWECQRLTIDKVGSGEEYISTALVGGTTHEHEGHVALSTLLTWPWPSHYSLLTTHYSLHTTHYSLPTTHYSLPTTHYSLLTTHYSLPTAHYLLPTTHYPLLTTHYSLPTAHYLLLTTITT